MKGAANISLPNGDWCLAAMVYIYDHSGTDRNTFLSAGANVDASGEISFGTLRLQDYGSTPGSPHFRAHDGSSLVQLRSTTIDFPTNVWAIQVAQRTGTTKQLWVITLGGSAQLIGSSTQTFGAVTPSTPMMVGRRYCRQLTLDDMKGTIAWVARGSFALSSAQMAALAAGECARRIGPWTEYLPFMQAGQTTYRSPIGGDTYTVTGYPTADKQTVRLW